jgi:hypothetical protein
MKTKFSQMALLVILGASLAAPVAAQPGGGPGMGPGMGPGGGGMGMRFNFDKDNTPGWALMNAEERAVHGNKMRNAKTYDECKALQAEHHQAMEARAKEKGVTLPAPRYNGCDRMKARGFFK